LVGISLGMHFVIFALCVVLVNMFGGDSEWFLSRPIDSNNPTNVR